MQGYGIYIGIPTANNRIVGDTVLTVFNLLNSGNTPSLVDTTISITANAMVHSARNQMAKEMLATSMSHILFLDDDMTLPPDALEMMIQDDKDIVGALAFTRRPPIQPTCYKSVTKDGVGVYRNIHNYPKNTVFEVDATGGACLLVKREVFEKMSEPWFEFTKKVGEDIRFCEKARELGFKVFVDTRIKAGHFGEIEIDETIYETILAMSAEDTKVGERFKLVEQKPGAIDREEKEEDDPFAAINQMGKEPEVAGEKITVS